MVCRSSTWRCVAALSCSCSVSGRRRPRRSKSWCCRNTVSTVKQVHRQHALGLGAAEPPPGQRRPLGRRFDARPVEDGPYRAGPDPEAQAAQLTVDATVAQLGFSLANRTTNARSSAVTAGRPRRCGSFRRWAMALAATAPGSQPPWGAGRRAATGARLPLGRTSVRDRRCGAKRCRCQCAIEPGWRASRNSVAMGCRACRPQRARARCELGDRVPVEGRRWAR